MSVTSQAPQSRSRPQIRKKANDDAAYFGPPLGASSSTKRQAIDRVDGEPRTKRKRVESFHTRPDADTRASLVEFIKLPTSTIHRYLTQFDIIPHISPSPLSEHDPPAPSSLSKSIRTALSRGPTPPPTTTPANRPRRDPKELPASSTARRRSSRLDDDVATMFCRPPILADVDELHAELAAMAESHFRDVTSIQGRDEVDTLASFMCAIERTKGGKQTSK